MYRVHRVVLWAGLISAVVLTSGCQKPPQAEIDSLQQSLSDAAAEQASVYAPEAWEQAQQAVSAVDSEVAAQGEKFALLRSYKQTNELIAGASQAIAAANEAAAQGRQQMMDESQQALDAAVAAAGNSQTMLADLEKCRRRPKGFAADLEAMTGSLTALDGQIQEVRALLDSQQLVDAKALATTVRDQADALAADLMNAKERLGC